MIDQDDKCPYCRKEMKEETPDKGELPDGSEGYVNDRWQCVDCDVTILFWGETE